MCGYLPTPTEMTGLELVQYIYLWTYSRERKNRKPDQTSILAYGALNGSTVLDANFSSRRTIQRGNIPYRIAGIAIWLESSGQRNPKGNAAEYPYLSKGAHQTGKLGGEGMRHELFRCLLAGTFVVL